MTNEERQWLHTSAVCEWQKLSGKWSVEERQWLHTSAVCEWQKISDNGFTPTVKVILAILFAVKVLHTKKLLMDYL